jgi:hypothetical protein
MKTGLLLKLLAVAVPVMVVLAVLALVVLVVALGLLRSVLAMRRSRQYAASFAPLDLPPPSPPPLLDEPAVRWWARGAYGLWTGGEDCASWEPSRAQEALSSWYGADDPQGLTATIAALRAGQTGSPAWDQVRAIDLTRIGLAAGYLSVPQADAEVRAIAASLRALYPSWEALAAAFESGMHAWQDSRGITDEAARGRVQHNLPALRARVWPQIPYGSEL